MVRSLRMGAVAVVVKQESPRQPDVVQLVAALDDYVRSLYPAESNHLLSIEALASPDVRFFVARLGGRAVGCGALRVDPTGYGEVKRMFVDPAARGRKLGREILHRLEEEARRSGLAWMRLETGVDQAEALGLYRAAGFRESPPFGDYTPDPLSVFMEKQIREA